MNCCDDLKSRGGLFVDEAVVVAYVDLTSILHVCCVQSLRGIEHRDAVSGGILYLKY